MKRCPHCGSPISPVSFPDGCESWPDCGCMHLCDREFERDSRRANRLAVIIGVIVMIAGGILFGLIASVLIAFLIGG